ncbi:MAG: penicillin-binding protein 1C [Breznakibacter sp.]
MRLGSFSVSTVRLTLALLLLLFLLSWPRTLFEVPYSTVVFDRDGQLLSAHIAADGQWRFPGSDSVPTKFETCLLMFEDEHFYHHPGINPLSIARAAWQNLSTWEIKSGGSTLTMQTIRLARPKSRNVWSKLTEAYLAFRMEFRYSKKEILSIYASHAPFGGNVVGIEAASWRYFGVPSNRLSWAESATLAVLPNSPALVNTARNRPLLKAKRDRLLHKMFDRGAIDEMELALSVDEPVVPHPEPLPQKASHLLAFFLKNNPGSIIHSSIDGHLQFQTDELLNRHSRALSANLIRNAAAIVADNRTGKVLAYVGNSKPNGNGPFGYDVDVIRSARSSGSILKPFLYAAALQDGLITPQGIVADVPTYYIDFSPQNYQRSYDGAVKSDEALSRSLNIPAVRMLDDYGTDRFLRFLRKAGLTTFRRQADHYGLSLILGGAETSLWDLAGTYASMARTLSNYPQRNFGYSNTDLRPLSVTCDSIADDKRGTQTAALFTAASIWFTFEALTNVQRPPEEEGWDTFANARRVAWKTGTSFGFRDAWAVGVTPEYTVAVWVGNASGEGRPGIVGGTAAAPLMFDIFRLLPQTTWFEMPFEDLRKETVCRQSGYLASPYCDETDTAYVPNVGATFPVCTYHRLVHLDEKGQYRVNENCYPIGQMTHRHHFVLPPLMEWYYRAKNPLYLPLPPIMPNCTDGTDQPMEFVYPRPDVALFIPKNLEGKSEKVVLRVAHRDPQCRIFWHVDDIFIGQTQDAHRMEADFTPGWHTLTLVDENGNRLTRRIQCVNK